MSDALAAAQAGYRELAEELEQALAHTRTVIQHLEDRELARAGAHGFALQGHLVGAQAKLNELAVDWAEHSTP